MKELIKKTGLLLMVLFAGLAVSSCSEDDDPPGVSDDLVGTWAVVSSYSAEYENGNLVYESNNGEVGQVYVLSKNGNINISGYDAGRWGASGSSFIIYWEEDGETYPEQYNMTKESADRVTISYDVTYNEDGTVNVMNAAWGTMQERDTVALNLTESHKTVKNIKSITQLPLTGAAGTMLFSVIGLLIAGAAVTVFVKSRSTKRALNA